MSSQLCHCGSGKTFVSCCQPFLEGQSSPATAEQLMRSRYSAFVIQNSDYLLASWHSSTRPSVIQFDPQQRWHKLTVKKSRQGQCVDQEGWVEFIAIYKANGRAHKLHENSYFLQEEGRWYYVNGVIA